MNEWLVAFRLVLIVRVLIRTYVLYASSCYFELVPRAQTVKYAPHVKHTVHRTRAKPRNLMFACGRQFCRIHRGTAQMVPRWHMRSDVPPRSPIKNPQSLQQQLYVSNRCCINKAYTVVLAYIERKRPSSDIRTSKCLHIVQVTLSQLFSCPGIHHIQCFASHTYDMLYFA